MSKSSECSADEESSTEKALRESPHCLSVQRTQGSQVWLVRSAEELAALKAAPMRSVKPSIRGALGTLARQVTSPNACSMIYGYRRVRAELRLGLEIVVSKKLVHKLMVEAGLRGVPTRKQRKNLANVETAADLVGRDFARAAPNQLWLTDITEHPTREGKVYCCVVLDAHSRKVVGWSIDTHCASRPTCRTCRRRADRFRRREPLVHAPPLRWGSADQAQAPVPATGEL